MTRVVVLGTGGTIAARHGADGALVPADGVGALVGEATEGRGPEVVARDVLAKDSSALTAADQVRIAEEVGTALAGEEVAGVVITHGTDSMEETAYLLDLVHHDERPVVLTGAQRPADAADADGPGNLADAIAVAADPASRGLGVVVCFGGQVLPARGTRKVHTTDPRGFASATGALGRVDGGLVEITARPADRRRLGPAALAIEPVRVDIVAVHPGTDAVGLRAYADAGARGIVLVGLGSGNATAAVAEAVGELSGRGIVVGLTTRVDEGPVSAAYGGGGGGADLGAAGAVPLGSLRAGQGRMLLLALIAALEDPHEVRAAIPAYVGG